MSYISDTFTESCGSFLQSSGFVLNPKIARDNYQSFTLEYSNDKGFILAFGFLPLDGKYAGIQCGRTWNESNGPRHLSGRYCDLANSLGHALPETYSLDGPEKTKESLGAMDKDLAESLPVVLAKMTIDDIEAIERKRYGAARFLQFALRRTRSRSIRVSSIEFED